MSLQARIPGYAVAVTLGEPRAARVPGGPFVVDAYRVGVHQIETSAVAAAVAAMAALTQRRAA